MKPIRDADQYVIAVTDRLARGHERLSTVELQTRAIKVLPLRAWHRTIGVSKREV